MMKTLMDKIMEGRQYRDIPVDKIQHRAEGDDLIVEGYATTFEQPYTLWSEPDWEVREVIAANAFDDCDMTDVIMQYNHEGRVFARVTNNTLALTPDDFGLATRARLNGTQLGREIFEEVDGGYSTKMSMGFVVAEDERTYTEDYETGKITVLRRITKIKKLYDVSIVSLPANDATSISARSFSEGVIAEIREEIAERQRRDRKKQRIRILTEVNKK